MSYRLEDARRRLLRHLMWCGKIHGEVQAFTSPETWDPAEKALEDAAARVAEMQPKGKQP